MIKNMGKIKTYADCYLYNKYPKYNSMIFDALMTDDFIDKASVEFNENVLVDIKRARVNSHILQVLTSPRTVLYYPAKPLPTFFKVLVAADPRSTKKEKKLFIDCTSAIFRSKNGWRTNSEVLLSHLISGYHHMVYNSGFISVNLAQLEALNFAKLFTYVIDYIAKISVSEANRDKCIYLASRYYEEGVAGIDTDRARKIAQQNANITDIKETFYNGIYTESNWYGKSKLQIEDFDNIIDEEAFEYFKENLDKKLASNIQGIITGDRLIIFYEKTFQIKFLYHGQTINQGVENNNSLIQLTADFSQIANGVYNIYSTQNAYIGFKKLIESNINYAFKLFDSKNINYSKKETIHFCTVTGNGNTVQYGFILRNDNLNSQTLDQTYKTVNYQQINPNKFRLIGLENVGATCYMNATLQCFFNVPTCNAFLTFQL